jgi:hypothetical protein
MIHLALLLALAAPPELKRARDRLEFGAWADAAGTVRQLVTADPGLSDTDAIEAYRILGIAEHHLGDLAQARSAFVNLLARDPDYTMDAFLVPPAIVEFFDKVKRDNEPSLAPIRAQKRALREQERLAEEARRKLLAEEQLRAGPPTKVIRVQERLYLFNWMPFGAGQFQNGQRSKGTLIAAGEVTAGLVNIGAILLHNQIAEDRSRSCISGQPGCSRPPYSDADRQLLQTIDIVKYASAAAFWGLYAWGVWDAHRYYIPVVETEIAPRGDGGTIKLQWSF